MPRPCGFVAGLFLANVQTAAIKSNKNPFISLQHLFHFIAYETTYLVSYKQIADCTIC